MASVSPIGVMNSRSSSSSPSSPPPTLRDWVHATNKGTRRFLSHWWHGTSPNDSSVSSKAASSPAPAMIAAICARDTEDLPLESGSSSQQICYTCYDSDNGDDENDEELHLELLKQLAMNDSDPPASGSSRASYFMYSSQKSGSAAA